MSPGSEVGTEGWNVRCYRDMERRWREERGRRWSNIDNVCSLSSFQLFHEIMRKLLLVWVDSECPFKRICTVRLIEKDAGLHLHLISIQDMGLKVAFTLFPS